MSTLLPRSQRRNQATRPSPAELRVTLEDLGQIDVMQELLLVLADPRASATLMERQVVRSRVLTARITERFCVRHPNRWLPELSIQIATLGNREIESVLLEFLEDVVTLGSETSTPPRP